MLFYFSILFFLYSLLFQKSRIRFLIFLETIILSFFFFSSVDPFIGMPIYIYFSIISILFSVSRIINGRNNKLIILGFFLSVGMLVQIFFLLLGLNNPKVLLLNQSNTDVFFDITSQLKTPVLDINVVKHFCFFLIFIVFLIANSDFFNPFDKKRMWSVIFKFYYLFIVFLIIQSILVNIIGVNQHDATAFIRIVFSLQEGVAEYSAFGIKSCQAWLQEPSAIIMIMPLFCYVYRRSTLTWKEFILLVLGVLVCFLSTSTTGIVISLVFFFLIFMKTILSKTYTTFVYRLLFGFLIISVLIVCALNFQSVFEKVIDFISLKTNYNSAGFRSRSLVLAVQAFVQSPILGIGIGTVYCHGMVIQVLANIGILGFCLSILFFLRSMKLQIKKKSLFLACVSLVIFCFSGLVQYFTSPYMIPVMIGLFDISILDDLLVVKKEAAVAKIRGYNGFVSPKLRKKEVLYEGERREPES